MNLVTLASGILASMLHVADTPGTQGAVDYAEFRVSRLRCVIGNNMAVGEHHAGYNGVFNLYAPDLDESPFVPAYAGLNLEHYFDGHPPREERAIFFEPRVAPMTFTRINETTAELHQPATPHYGVESWTRFELKEPYYVDMTFRCIPRKPGLEGGWFGVFWASYINAPLDKSIYFLAARSNLDKPLWTQYCTQEHGRDSTVCHESDQWSIPFAGGAGSLFSSISPLRYSAPFFYGQFRDKVLIYIFEPNPHLRFSHSPSGGGLNAEKGTQNPAWDFQLLIPDYQVNTEYRLTMRLVYKLWVDRADVIAEVRKYLGSR
jgi:hypothetical protein